MPTFLGITLNARLRPLDRGRLYEDPLQEVLDDRLPGSDISGGGTLMAPGGEPLVCDLDVEREGDPEAGLALVIETLQNLGAPKGSKARPEEGEAVGFGTSEGLGVYLNGTDLPAQVYEESDVNELIGLLEAALGDSGSIHSYWEGPRETALYFYGPSAQRMRDLMRDVLGSHPLAQQSRLVDLTA